MNKWGFWVWLPISIIWISNTVLTSTDICSQTDIWKAILLYCNRYLLTNRPVVIGLWCMCIGQHNLDTHLSQLLKFHTISNMLWYLHTSKYRPYKLSYHIYISFLCVKSASLPYPWHVPPISIMYLGTIAYMMTIETVISLYYFF